MENNSQTEDQNSSGRYRISVPALSAARIIARNFAFVPVPGSRIEPTLENIAIIIDWATRLPRVLPVLNWFVNSNPWYECRAARSRSASNDAEDQFLDWYVGAEDVKHSVRLEDELGRVQDGIRQLQIAGEEIQRSENGSLPSASAWTAARKLLEHFSFRRIGRTAWSERNLALIIDTATNIFRLERVIGNICSRIVWQNREELRKQVELLRVALRAVETVRNRLPSRSIRQQNVVFLEPKRNPDTLAKRLERRPTDFKDLSARLAVAQSAEEERSILTQWKEHTRNA